GLNTKSGIGFPTPTRQPDRNSTKHRPLIISCIFLAFSPSHKHDFHMQMQHTECPTRREYVHISATNILAFMRDETSFFDV
ncbi:unnamed protein product, partial [Staurois parvus]